VSFAVLTRAATAPASISTSLFRSRTASAPRASFFVLVVLLHYSTVISKLSDENRIMAQRLAILEHRLRSDDEDEDG
jgi:hypothetical protein